VNAVAALLNDPSPYMKGRAIYLLYQLGPEGRSRAGSPESHTDPALRIAAFRAMRRAGLDVGAVAARLARDPDPGVRREVAVSLRDRPAAESLDLLVDIARGYDGLDRHYLEAWGTGATGKEAALYPRLRRDLGVKNDPLTWSPAFARLAWRLHVPAAVADLRARAEAPKLPMPDRRLALDTLAFIDDPAASKAMLALAAPSGTFREIATFWLLNRMSSSWASHGLLPALKSAGIYDPDTIVLKDIATPPPAAGAVEPPIAEVLRLTGDASRGKAIASRCLMCHTIGDTGTELGPALDGWGRGKSPDVIATAIVDPNAEIALGYGGTEIRTKDGKTIQGLVIKQNDPVMMRSMGGVTQIIPNDRIAGRVAMTRTLMMSPSQLAMTAQDIADVIAFLRE
jgi:putative heme-binding domain-containing protein